MRKKLTPAEKAVKDSAKIVFQALEEAYEGLDTARNWSDNTENPLHKYHADIEVMFLTVDKILGEIERDNLGGVI